MKGIHDSSNGNTKFNMNNNTKQNNVNNNDNVDYNLSYNKSAAPLEDNNNHDIECNKKQQQ